MKKHWLLLSIFILGLFFSACSMPSAGSPEPQTTITENENFDFLYEVKNNSSKTLTVSIIYADNADRNQNFSFDTALNVTQTVSLPPKNIHIFELDSKALQEKCSLGCVYLAVTYQGRGWTSAYGGWKIEYLSKTHIEATITDENSGIQYTDIRYSLEPQYLGYEVIEALDDTKDYTPELEEETDCVYIYEVQNKTSQKLLVSLRVKKDWKSEAVFSTQYIAIPVGKSYKFKIGESKLDEFNDFGNNFFIVPYFRWEKGYEDGGYSTDFNYNKHHILSVSDPQNNNERFHHVFESKQLEFETDNTVYEYDETECASEDFTAASLGTIVSKTGFDGLTVTYKPLTELSHIVYMLCRLDEISYSKKETAAYKREVREYFKDYMDMNVIKFCKNNRQYFDKHNERKIYSQLDDYSKSDSTQFVSDIWQFYKYLLAFAEKSNFAEFFTQHKAYYEERIIQEGLDTYESLKGWSGSFLRPQETWTTTINMIKDEWCDISYDLKNKENWTFYINLASGRNGDYTGLAHELSHPYTNDIAQNLYASDLKDKIDALWQANDGSIATRDYFTPYSYLMDILARACAGRYVLEHFGDDVYENYCKGQDGLGFAVVGGLADTLEAYEKGSYVNLDDFYDEIYKFFAKALADY